MSVLSGDGQPQGWNRPGHDARTIAPPSHSHLVPPSASVIQEQVMEMLKVRGTTFSLGLGPQVCLLQPAFCCCCFIVRRCWETLLG